MNAPPTSSATATRPASPPHDDAETTLPADLHKPGPLTIVAVIIVFLSLLAGLFLIGWYPHQQRQADALADANDRTSDVVSVNVERPKPIPGAKDILLPGDVRPNQETAIYPRANGYLKTLKADIGDHVQAGQLLAEIDTPEVDADLAQSKASLEQARASLTKSQSDLDLAQRTLQRFEDWQKADTSGVTEQQLDEKRSAYHQALSSLAAAKASVAASEAAVLKLTVMQKYEKVYAPFSGTVTARNYDLGALLAPTNTSTTRELFRIAQTDTLRVFVNVPQAYATHIQTGQPAVLMVRNYPAREFQGTVARSAGALDPTTRTLPFELHFANSDGALFAGMFGQVRLLVAERQPVLVIPTSALLFNANGLEVALVRDSKVHLQKISVGRDLGTEMEVTAGLSSQDQIVANPGERLAEGLTVKVISEPVSQNKPAISTN